LLFPLTKRREGKLLRGKERDGYGMDQPWGLAEACLMYDFLAQNASITCGKVSKIP
jgi:hypothetical protein